MTLLVVFQVIGTVAFAISGACVAVEHKMDLLGVCTLGMTTAVGGGIIRDLILDVTPPLAFTTPEYALLSILVSVIIFLPGIRRYFRDLNHPLYLLIDSLGLAVFTVVGARAGMMYGKLFLAIFVGVLTGVGGGVMRDLFANKQPDIFRKRFYATASIIGAAVAAALYSRENLSYIAGAGVIVVLRFLAARFCWSLPRAE